jgi:hypothetical protein
MKLKKFFGKLKRSIFKRGETFYIKFIRSNLLNRWKPSFLIPVIIVIVIISTAFIFSNTILASLGLWSTDSLNKGLVGYWPLDGAHYNATTNRVDDTSGYGNHGTNSGATLTNGVKGESNGAMNFNGGDSTGNYINCGGNNFFNDITGELTVNAWVYPHLAATTQGRMAVNTYDYMGSPTSQDTGWYLGQVWTGNYFEIRIYNGAGGSDNAVYSNFFTTYLDQWVHVVGVYKPSQYLRLYINGTLVANDTSVMSNIVYSNDPLIIGRRSAEGQSYWNGSIQDVRIYNRALSPAEITRLYESYKPKLSTTTLNKGLVLDMPLRPGSEELGTEKVSNGNFDSNTTGWSAGNSTLSSVSGGEVGNALQITNTTTSGGTASQMVSVTAGKTYRFSYSHKNGTSNGHLSLDKDAYTWAGDIMSRSHGDSSWVKRNYTFIATTNTVYILLAVDTQTATNTTLYDSISLKEVRSADTTPNANHGAIYGADIRNHGASFNGANNYVNLGTGPKPTNAITMAAWVKPVVVGGSIHNVIDHHNGYEFQERADSYWRTYISLSTAGWISATCTSLTVQANNWYFVSGTYDSATGMIKTYVNGNLCATASGYTGQTIAYSGADKTYIGSRNDGVQRLFNGQISDVKIYSRALSASEILDLYQGKEVSGAILDMPLSDKTGFKDISGNGNNGTNNGATIIGESADFDGTDDYVYESNNLGVPTNGPGSISCWFRLNQSASSKGGDIGIHKELYQESANNFLYIASGGANEYISFVPAINTWYHAVVIWNGDSSSVDIYINNIKYDINVQGGSSEFSALTNFTIGQTGSRYMDGQISDVQIYSRALSTTEIASLYAKGRSNAGSAGITTGSLNKGLILDMPLKSKYEKTGDELAGNFSFNGVDNNSIPCRVVTDSNPSNLGVYTFPINGSAATGTRVAFTATYKTVPVSGDVNTFKQGMMNSDWSGQVHFSRPDSSEITTSHGTITINGNQRLTAYIGNVASTGSVVYIYDYSAKSIQTADTTPYGNHGIIYGATVGTNYTTFNGSSNYIKLDTNDTVLSGKQEFTTSFWFSPTTTYDGSNYQYIFNRNPSNDESSFSLRQTTKLLQFTVRNSGTYNTLVSSATNNWVGGQWYHVTGTYKAGGTAKIYINGILENTDDTPGTSGVTGTGEIIYLGNANGSTYYFAGSISNVKIYNRALSPAEITSLFDKERGQFGI